MAGASGAGPERTCVGCGEKRGKGELVRLSGGPAGLRALLETGEGRGAYVCPDIGCLERSVKRSALQRVLETEVGPLTVERLREAIQEAVLQKIERLLGLARRARKVVVGSRAVWHALHTGRVGLLLASREISARGENRLCVEAKKRGTPVVGLFSGQELGAVLGGPPREVVGILNDGFANGIVQIVRYWIP